MHESDLAALCRHLDLGKPVRAPQAVTGGLLHRMWRLDTERATHAIKELNPGVMARPGIDEVYRRSERVARDVAAANLPAVAALVGPAGPLQKLDHGTYLVFAWVEGKALPSTAAPPARARRIGSVLADIHKLDLDPSDHDPPADASPGRGGWEGLVSGLVRSGVGWIGDGRALRRDLSVWIDMERSARDEIDGASVVSHRDLDPKNVLWSGDGHPWLIDWESAGLVDPSVEVLGAALNWGGLAAGPVAKAAFDSVLEAYVEVSGRGISKCEAALRACMGDWLGWAAFNLRRALGRDGESAEERETGLAEGERSVRILRRMADGLDRWTDWAKVYV